MAHDPDKSQVQSVIDIGGALATIVDPEAMRRHILEKTVALLGAGTGSLFVVDEPSGDLLFDVALGPAGALLKHAIRLKRGEGLAGSVAQSGETEVVNDVATDPRHAARVGSMSGFAVNSALTVPLKYGSRVIGVLQILNKEGEGAAARFTADDVWSAETIARFVSVAMESSRQRTEFERQQKSTLELLSALIAQADPSTSPDHGERVAGIVRGTAARLGRSDAEIAALRTAALLHDIGKVSLAGKIPPASEPIDDAGRALLRTHPRTAAELLTRVPSYAAVVAPAIAHHHERFDGSGYPDGLAGDAIPIGARILAAADTFEVMTNVKAYGPTFLPADAITELQKLAGTQLDPKVVEALAAGFKGGDFRHLAGLNPTARMPRA